MGRDRWWFSDGDRRRLAAFADQREQYRLLAEQAAAPEDRRHYERLVRDADARIRIFRTHRFSMWLFWVAVCSALLPWALLPSCR